MPVELKASDYAKNGHLYRVFSAGGYWHLGDKLSELKHWFKSGLNTQPILFRNGSLNDESGALRGAVALSKALKVSELLLVYAPISMSDYPHGFRSLNPKVDDVILKFNELTQTTGKGGAIWTHSFAGPSTTIALADLSADKVDNIHHCSVAPAFYHADEYYAAIKKTEVGTSIYQASRDLVSRFGSFTQNLFKSARGKVHTKEVRNRPNIHFTKLSGGAHPLADYLAFQAVVS
jgi:hypothetical protein